VSADLFEAQAKDGRTLSLTMNVHGTAFLQTDEGWFPIMPTPEGLEQARELAKALSEWADHVQQSGLGHGH
jgi:hypothetical protein